MRKNESVRYKRDLIFEKQVVKGEYDDFFEGLDPENSKFEDDLVGEFDDEEHDEDDDLYGLLDEDEEEIEDPIFQALSRAEMNFDEDGEFQYADGFREEKY